MSARGINAEVAWPWEQELGPDSVEQDTWLVSFADILMLLLTLFVLLLAFKDGADVTQPGQIANVKESVDVIVTQPLELAIAASNIPALESTAVPATIAVPEPVLIPAVVTTAEPQLAVAQQTSLSVTPVPLASVTTPAPPIAEKTALDDVSAPAVNAEPLASSIDAQTTVQHATIATPAVTAESLTVMTATESLRIAAPTLTLMVKMAGMPGMFGLPAVLELPTSATAEKVIGAGKSADKLLADLQDSALQGRVEVTVLPDSVSLEISDNILFAPASAALTPNGVQLLDELAETLQAHPYSLSVEGHTDNVPIKTARYPSNWELSSSRATEVTRRLIERGIAADRVRAVGYADTHPRADNATAEGKARNRRVSLVLMEQR